MKVLGRPVQPNADCPYVLQLAKSWIRECSIDHTECQYPESLSGDQFPILPSRVIDIGEVEEQLPRLLSSKGMRGRWVALSHRWPSAEKIFLKTVRDNIHILEEGFLLTSLPTSFRDAIKITRALGIRFLWIDSLCIIQDSMEDWSLKSARMADTFKNAFVTIAAASTADSLGGILLQREWVPASQACRLPVLNDSISSEVSIDFCIDKNHKNKGEVEAEKINYLSRRAWCFQESQLSHRLLTFDRLQMSFTCLRHGLHEDRQNVPAVAREYRNHFLCHFKGVLKEHDIQGLYDSIRVWYRAVEDYTARDLTFSSDKLTAMSGMADVVGNFIKDKYYAGLWHKSLPRSLLWSPYDEEDLPNLGYVASKSPHYRAPSWSWACIDGQISNFLCREALSQRAVAKVLDISTDLSTPSAYGQVTKGLLVIRGPFKKQIRGPILSVWPQQPKLWREDVKDQDSEDISHCIFDHTIPPIESPIWCLQITERFGLILMPLPEDKNLYERIGIFHLRMTDIDNIRIPLRFSLNDIRTVQIV